MMCIRKKVLLELLDKFPLINDYYIETAKQRRIEFRRVSLKPCLKLIQIKRIYLEENQIASDSEEDDKNLKSKASNEILTSREVDLLVKV